MVWFLVVTLLGRNPAPQRDTFFWHSPPPHAVLLLAVRPGTDGEAVLRCFGRPDNWGDPTYSPSSRRYNLSVEWMLNGGRGPLAVPGEVTWAYGTGMGYVYFVVVKDKKVVRTFRGAWLSVSCD
jgi:hypothetical protein